MSIPSFSVRSVFGAKVFVARVFVARVFVARVFVARVFVARVFVASVFVAVLASCTPKAASFPDDADVGKAQSRWCDALATTLGDGFQHDAECRAARPTGSADFVARTAECYLRRHQELGEDAPDMGALISDCTGEIVGGAEPGDVSRSPVVQARCRRAERCDGAEPAACVAAFGQLDGAQRATFTSIYNLRAQDDIAECLDDAACGPEAEKACFNRAYERRVWTPFSLAADPSVAPVP